MHRIRFDVNDGALRSEFLHRTFMDAVGQLGADDLPLWGGMRSQHVVEHLQWAFAFSTGDLDAPCKTPAQLLDRARRFLYDNRHTPHGFKNPLLGDIPPPFRFSDLDEARTALQAEVDRFHAHYLELPDAVHIHPIFGALGAEGWQRSHYKHCVHHLLQFGLVSQASE